MFSIVLEDSIAIFKIVIFAFLDWNINFHVVLRGFYKPVLKYF